MEDCYVLLFEERSKKISPAGNRTPVSRVTGGDTHHYTTEDSTILRAELYKLIS